MRILTACASALALAVSVPAVSQGNGNGGGGGPKAERGGGGGNAARASRGGGQRADRGNRGGNQQADRGNRGGGGPAMRGNGNNRGNADADRGNRGNGNANRGNRGGAQQADRGNGNAGARGRGDRPAQADARGRGNDRVNRGRGNARDFAGQRERNMRAAADRAANRQRLAELRDGRGDRRGRDRDFDIDFYRERRWNDDVFRARLDRVRGLQRSAWQGRFCPPGLANKNELCMPPGQYRKLFNFGSRFDRAGYALPTWYRASYLNDPFRGLLGNMFDYRYANGYAYRLDPETRLIAGLLPILGGALGLGQPLPTGYNVYNLPYQYRGIYPDADYLYRYGDGAIYRVDPASNRILGISELLTPQFVVGQPLPSGYGAYNVPYGYRGTYYDNDNYLYRYNNGRVYQVDPESMLVLAAIDLLI